MKTDKEIEKERIKVAKQELIKNLIIQIKKPEEKLGGQHCGMPIYPISVRSEEFGIEISVSTHRANHKNKELAILLMELAIDELVK